VQRALKPGLVLPHVAPNVRQLMQAPRQNQLAAKHALQHLKGLFPLEEIQSKKEKVTADQIFGQDKAKR
jgi:hypothetical protein